MRKMDPAVYSTQTQPTASVTHLPAIWTPTLAGEWVDSVQGSQQYLLEGLLPDDSNILMSGKAKRAHKSWLVHAICMALATGKQIGPLVPFYKEGVPVWYLSAEGSKFGTKNRWLMLEHGLKVPFRHPNLYFTHREPILMSDRAWVTKIKTFIRSRGVKLLILDPFVMFVNGDENSVEDMAAFMRVLNEFRAEGCSVMFIHHLRKSSRDGTASDPDEEIRGSSAFAGFYDQHWAIRQSIENTRFNDLIIRSKDDEGLLYKIRWNIDKVAQSADFEMNTRTAEEVWVELKGTLIATIMSGWEYTKPRLVDIVQSEGNLEEKEAERMVAEYINEGKIVPLGKTTWTKAKLAK